MPLPMYQKQTREEAIRFKAFLLWEQAGKPLGRSLEFWLQAERAYERDNWPYFGSRREPYQPNPNYYNPNTPGLHSGLNRGSR